MGFADWLNINCDLIAELLDKSCIGYKFAEGLGSMAPVTCITNNESNRILSATRTMIFHGKR